jgi:hypothetical protein
MSSELESGLIGHWIHSQEEDSNNIMVFRPNTHPFPPARGRYEYKLEKGGKMLFIGPGPTDKRESADGTWSLEEDSTLTFRPATGGPLRYRIIALDGNQLVMAQLN